LLPKEILKIVPLFRNLDDDDLRLVSTCLHKESYPKGAVIFRQGDAGDTMYIVESGQVAVIGEEGKEAIAFMGPGSFVGEISLLLARPRSATLQVILDAQLWALSKADFEWLVMSRPSIGLEMMRELSKRLVTTTQRKRFQTRPRRITAVFGLKGLELAHAVYAQLKTPVAVLPLPNAQAAADFPLNRGVMVMGISDLTEASLAERLSYQVEVFKHVVVLLPQQYDDLAEKAVELADTVVSIGRNPAWFTPIGKRGDFWISGGASIDLDRIARRLVNRTVGLALSSGGSRGLAHLGVLKVLMEENIPVDLVAGTSAGALFGALYALGWSAEQLVTFTGELKAATRLLNWDFNFPPRTALVKGKIARDKLIANWVEHRDFEDTLTPLYIVAADAYTGEEVIFDSGPLADAIRASLSIPILAEPWHYRQRFLLDGGVVNPLPASVLRERGADIVIGSSVVQPMGQSYRGDTQKMPNILQIVSNIFSTMEAEVIGKQLPLIDVLIQHKVSANHALDFDQARALVEIGEQSARQMLPEIKEAMQRVPEG
jgi:predicted acylesterase/phospholipase RssA/CRP-like cAMP-binding protein